jgi:hypothetical protein
MPSSSTSFPIITQLLLHAFLLLLNADQLSWGLAASAPPQFAAEVTNFLFCDRSIPAAWCSASVPLVTLSYSRDQARVSLGQASGPTRRSPVLSLKTEEISLRSMPISRSILSSSADNSASALRSACHLPNATARRRKIPSFDNFGLNQTKNIDCVNVLLMIISSFDVVAALLAAPFLEMTFSRSVSPCLKWSGILSGEYLEDFPLYSGSGLQLHRPE